MDALESYLTLQRIRFGERLVCQIQCETAARSVQVPPMMIQPLLENAFNYGAETSPMPLQVKLSARLADRFLNITVANTGRWLPPDPRRSPGSGLRSLRQRLQLLIDGHTSVETEESEGWVKVTIRIPLPDSVTSRTQ
jgi:LytS/YehU family sensor histidine kinase